MKKGISCYASNAITFAIISDLGKISIYMVEPFPTSSKKKNIQSFTLIHSNNFVLIEPQQKKFNTQLVIEKKSLKIVQSQSNKKFIFNEQIHSQIISLVLGIVKIVDNSYLVYVPEVYCPGNYLEHVVYQIANVDFIPLIVEKMSQQDSNEVQSIKQEIKNFFSYGFFFSFTCDLTLNYNKMVSFTDSNPDFNWSSNFLTQFQKISNQWKVPVIQGYFGKFHCNFKGGVVDYYLISRRSRNMSGTRFYYRGINDEGSCANFVESEQVIKISDKVVSHRMIRGSTPVFWDQKSISAPIQLTRNKQLTKIAFINHINSLNKNYGRIVCVNLLDKAKEQFKLTRAYQQIFSECFDLFWEIIRYQYFDLNEGQKNNHINLFIEKNSKVLGTFGFDVYDIQNSKFLTEQNGVYRISCLDCLGRSSQFMMKLAFSVVNLMFKQLDMSLQNTVFFKDIYQQMDSDIKKCHEFTKLFMLAWAENRDFLSKLYCGMDSVCSNLTALGRKSFFDQIDLGHSLSKPQPDQIKLKTLDLIAGQSKSIQLNTFQPTQPFNIFISTWNVSDYDPKKVVPSKIFKKMENPDMIVFGLQQMVELNANNIMTEDNEKRSQEWKKKIDEYVNKLPTTFIFVDKLELVGLWMIVYVASKWKKSIRGVHKEAVKTGMGGKLGNKGAVVIRIKIEETTINLINAHLQSGDSKLQMRIQNLKDIHEKAFNQNIQGVKNQARIQNCDYKFLLGDLNFRINIPYEQARLILKQRRHFKATNDTRACEKLLNELVKKDQLLLYKMNPEAQPFVSSYVQYPLQFQPTYKMERHQPQYTSQKNRVPSWCDRILIWTDKSYNQRFYQSVPDMFGSDHRPVVAEYSIAIQKAPIIKQEDKKQEQVGKQFRDSQFEFSA